jgi:GAF domain-containing protein
MEQPILSELAVPLVQEGEVVGVLNVESPLRAVFDEDDQRLLEIIAGQILIGLHNAEEHAALERERERQRVAAEITRVVGQTLDFDEVTGHALEAVIGYLATDEQQVVGTLQRLDREAGELVDVAGVGYEAGREDVRVPLGQGVTGQVAETGKPLLIEDLSDEQWRDVFIDVMEAEVRSELAVPLVREGEVWGVLNVESPQVAAFDGHDQRLMETVAGQILIALRNAEEHRKLEQEQARRVAAEEWSALSEAAAGLMHHLGNYLGIVPPCVRDTRHILEGAAEAFTTTDLADLDENLDTIYENALAGIGLVESLNRAFVGEFPKLELVDVNLLLSRALQIARLGVEVVPQYADDLPLVKADPSSLLEVFAELIKNAQKAMPERGGRLSPGTRQVGDQVEIWIADNGRGIPKGELDRIFTLFHKVDRDTSGHGIGLARVRRVIRSFDGEVYVHSDGVGSGTTVTIRLPAQRRTE